MAPPLGDALIGQCIVCGLPCPIRNKRLSQFPPPAKDRCPLDAQRRVIRLLTGKPQPVQNISISTLNVFTRRREKQIAIASIVRRKSPRREEHCDRSAAHVGMTPAIGAPPSRFGSNDMGFTGR